MCHFRLLYLNDFKRHGDIPFFLGLSTLHRALWPPLNAVARTLATINQPSESGLGLKGRGAGISFKEDLSMGQMFPLLRKGVRIVTPEYPQQRVVGNQVIDQGSASN